MTLKDSGDRQVYESGMIREPESGKPRFDLCMPLNIPFDKQMLTRFAMQMSHGADKYDPRNWESANSQAEYDRYMSSAFRHFMQWFNGEDDEDHAAAVYFNIMAAETVKYRMSVAK